MVETGWGLVALVGEGRRLRRVILPGYSKAKLVQLVRRSHSAVRRDCALFPRLQEAIKRYFDGHEVSFDAQPALEDCPPFFARVYDACRRVGYGQVVTYGELARMVGRPGAARAVGAAMAGNPVPLIVPCHRVVAANGRLGGFSAAGGTALKRRLLALERVRLTH